MSALRPYNHAEAVTLLCSDSPTIWQLHVGGMSAGEIARRMMTRKPKVVSAIRAARKRLLLAGMDLPENLKGEGT
jgi:hypothetical protein